MVEQENPSSSPKRRAVNLTVRSDVLRAARDLGVNTSQAAEAGILAAIAQTRSAAWVTQYRGAIQAHNRRVETAGVLLPAAWAAADAED